MLTASVPGTGISYSERIGSGEVRKAASSAGGVVGALFIIALVVWLLSIGAAQASGLYKCTDAATGKVTFSQVQCAADAAPVEVNVRQPTPEQVRQAQDLADANNRYIEEGIQRRREARAEADRQQAIADVQAQHAAERRAIARRRSTANNNVAGAALEGALATDAAAADARYQADLNRLIGH